MEPKATGAARTSRADTPAASGWEGAGMGRCGLEVLLLQRVHQTRNGAVEFLVRTPHLFDHVDGMKNRGVMLTAELPADFRQRCGGELLDDVHRHLARKGDGTSVTADFQVLLA